MPKALVLVTGLLFGLSVSVLCGCSSETDDVEKQESPQKFTITVIPIGNTGLEGIRTNVSEAEQGATIEFTATLGAERRVALSVDGVVITPSTISINYGTATFTMPANAVTVIATFSDIPPTLYGITVNQAGATGSDNITANVTEAAQGTTITLTATLGTGRRVVLSADGVVITPSTINTNNGTSTFTMPANAVAVSATFSDIPPTLYGITVNQTGATGSDNITANVAEAAEGTTVILTATIGAGRRVALSADGVVITPSTISINNGTATFTMPANAVAVTATFSDILYPITITPRGLTGSEKVVANVSTAPQGTTITLTATLGASRCVSLSADGVMITPSTINTNNGTATFTMPGDAVAVTATFSDILYPINITLNSATGSEKVVANITTAPQGSTITLTATLGTGRRVVLSTGGAMITPTTINASGDTATFVMPGAAVNVISCFFTASTRTVNSKDFNMHYVPSGGTLIMGKHVASPTQTVTLTKNFWMGETEVTQGLWEAVWGTTWPETAPSSTFGLGAIKPAYEVSWYDAVAFCNLLTVADGSIANNEQVYFSDASLTTVYTKVNAASNDAVYVDWSKKGYRLPTEAEWEYSARYIDGTSWNGGDHVSGDTSAKYISSTVIGNYAWYSGNELDANGDIIWGVRDVGQKTSNALGLKDMSGNAWEWCYDWYAEYSDSSILDPTGPSSGSLRVLRGGAYCFSGDFLRCAFREDDIPTLRVGWVGFRLCRNAD